MARQITITYPDELEGLDDFMIEYTNDYGETFDTDGADNLDIALELIKKHERPYNFTTGNKSEMFDSEPE